MALLGPVSPVPADSTPTAGDSGVSKLERLCSCQSCLKCSASVSVSHAYRQPTGRLMVQAEICVLSGSSRSRSYRWMTLSCKHG